MGKKRVPELAKHPLMSHWQEELPTNVLRAPREATREFDVVVVGGGLSGFSTALHLARLGPLLTVAVLDARDVAGGASGRNGGLVRPAAQGPFAVTKERFGIDDAKRLFRFERENALQLKSFCSKFVAEGGGPDPLLKEFPAGGIKGLSVLDDPHELKKDWEEWERNGCNLESRFISKQDIHRISGYRNSRFTENGGFTFKEFRVHSARLVLAIAQSALQNPNVDFYPHCHVLNVVRVPADNNKSSHLFELNTSIGKFFAKSRVYATNAWTSALIPALEITPVRNQVISTTPTTNPFWKNGDFAFILNGGFEYMSGRGDGRIILGGMRYLAENMDFGCDRDDELNPTVSKALREYLPTKFDGFENDSGFKVEREWAGICGYTNDNLPIVGSLEDVPRCVSGEFVIAGFCGHGMTRCFLAGRAVAEMVLGLPVLESFPHCFKPRACSIRAISTEKSTEKEIATERVLNSVSRGHYTLNRSISMESVLLISVATVFAVYFYYFIFL